ncbi:MAG: glycosyltransferase family 4 protein [Chloroflexota bacterium]
MLTQFYPPVLGGLERHVKDLSEALAGRGHEVAVITLRQGGWGQEMPAYEEVQGVRLYRIRGTVSRAEKLLFVDERRSYAPPFPDPELALAIRRVLAQERPQIVHAHNWLSFSYLPLKRWSGAKLVITLHEFGLSCGKWTFIHQDAFCTGPEWGKCRRCLIDHYGLVKGAMTLMGQRVMSRTQNRLVDMYLPVSQAVAEGSQLVDSGLPYEVVPNFIPDASTSPPADWDGEVARLPTEPFMLFVGSFGKQKGIDVLLEAYRGLDTGVPLVLIGYELSDFPLSQLDIPANVHIFKNWPNTAVMEAWRRSHIGLVPSNWPEPSPTVVMEAMVAGVPVIASRVGGIPDIVADGESGLLVPPGDADALRQAMHQLLNDPEQCRQMSTAARRRVTAFQAHTVVSRIEAIYHQLCHS